MEKEETNNTSLTQQFDDFKCQNPKVVEAMKLFGISAEKYQEAMHALHGPRIYQSNSTVRLDKSKQ